MDVLSPIVQVGEVIIGILLVLIIILLRHAAVLSMLMSPLLIILDWSLTSEYGPTSVSVISAGNILVLASYLSIHGISHVADNGYGDVGSMLSNIVYGREMLLVLLVWVGVVVFRQGRSQQDYQF